MILVRCCGGEGKHTSTTLQQLSKQRARLHPRVYNSCEPPTRFFEISRTPLNVNLQELNQQPFWSK